MAAPFTHQTDIKNKHQSFQQQCVSIRNELQFSLRVTLRLKLLINHLKSSCNSVAIVNLNETHKIVPQIIRLLPRMISKVCQRYLLLVVQKNVVFSYTGLKINFQKRSFSLTSFTEKTIRWGTHQKCLFGKVFVYENTEYIFENTFCHNTNDFDGNLVHSFLCFKLSSVKQRKCRNDCQKSISLVTTASKLNPGLNISHNYFHHTYYYTLLPQLLTNVTVTHTKCSLTFSRVIKRTFPELHHYTSF